MEGWMDRCICMYASINSCVCAYARFLRPTALLTQLDSDGAQVIMISGMRGRPTLEPSQPRSQCRVLKRFLLYAGGLQVQHALML